MFLPTLCPSGTLAFLGVKRLLREDLDCKFWHLCNATSVGCKNVRYPRAYYTFISIAKSKEPAVTSMNIIQVT